MSAAILALIVGCDAPEPKQQVELPQHGERALIQSLRDIDTERTLSIERGMKADEIQMQQRFERLHELSGS